MCWFITVGIEKKAAAAIEGIGQGRGGLGVRLSVNRLLAAIFPPSDARYEITHGQCSCDFLGRQDSEDEARLRRLYQNKGWTEAKIARALADRSHARERSRVHGRNNEAKTRLHDLLVDQAKQLGSVRVFAHFYKGSPDEEVVASSAFRKIAADQFLLSHLAEDVLVEIVDEAGQNLPAPDADPGAHRERAG